VVYEEHIYGGTNSKHAADGDKTHNFNIAGDDEFDWARKDDSDTTIILTSLHKRPEQELSPFFHRIPRAPPPPQQKRQIYTKNKAKDNAGPGEILPYAFSA
jgi:hypothetical protein